MEIELVQITGRDDDTMYGLERVLTAIADYAADTELVVFPETYLTSFPGEDNIAALAEPLNGPTASAAQRVTRERNASVAIGIAEANAGRYYDTTLLIVLDDIALKYRKTHLWASDRGVFAPGDHYATVLWDGIRVGLLVYFNIEFPEGARALSQLDAELITVTNGSMGLYGLAHRTAIMAHAMKDQAYAVMVNRVGHGDSGLVFAGGSTVTDPYGQLLCEAGREEYRQIVELDLGRLQDVRQDCHCLEERRLILPGERREHSDGLRELPIL